MFCLLYILLVRMLQLNIVLDQVFYLLVLLGEGTLQIVDFVVLRLEIVANAGVLLLVALQFLLQNCVLLRHLVDERLHLDYLATDLGQPSLVVAHRSCQLFNLEDRFVLLGPQTVVLVEQFLVIRMQ